MLGKPNPTDAFSHINSFCSFAGLLGGRKTSLQKAKVNLSSNSSDKLLSVCTYFYCRPNSPSFFLSGLEECPGFTNPSSGGNLKDVLGIAGYESETKPSLLKTIQTYVVCIRCG